MLWYPIPMDGDEDTLYLIAGDLWEKGRHLSKMMSNGKSWLANLSEQFKYVVYVLGNHDYWGANLRFQVAKERKMILDQGLKNVFLLENEPIVLDQVKLIGGTLWTDYKNGDPHVTYMAPQVMSPDHRYIKVGEAYHRLHPSHLHGAHIETREAIFRNAKKDNKDQRLFVMTHHAPSVKSIHPMYMTGTMRDDTNYYYYSELGNRIADHEDIELWMYGHTHAPMDYTIGKSRIISNQRGYVSEQTGWNPLWRLDL
jgi:hypothetical protein